MARTDQQLADAHRYRLSNGEIATSVTRVLDFTDDGKSMRFAHAAAKLTREGLDFAKVWRDKAQAGTRRHSHMEKWLSGEAVDSTDDDLPFLDALEAWITAHDVEMVLQECVVLSDTFGYGGRFDLLAWVTTDGQRDLWLIDLKTGQRYLTSVALQLNAYAFADGIAFYHSDGSLAGLKVIGDDREPGMAYRPTRLGALYVDEAGAELVEVPYERTTFDVFVSLLRTRALYQQLEKSVEGEKE